MSDQNPNAEAVRLLADGKWTLERIVVTEARKPLAKLKPRAVLSGLCKTWGDHKDCSGWTVTWKRSERRACACPCHRAA